MADNQSREVAEMDEYYIELGNSAEEAGDKVGQSLGNLSVKVDVDCSEALTGLKALTREARKATQAIAELDEVKKAQDYPVHYLSGLRYYSKEDLTQELAKRNALPTVYDLRAQTIKDSLKDGKKNEQDALAYITELEAMVTEVESKFKQLADLKSDSFSTKEITEELSKREGVKAVNFYTNDKITVSIEDTFGTWSEEFNGPGRVLVVTD